MPTIRDALQSAKAVIAPVSDSASLDAQVLLAEVLGVERAYLLAHLEQPLTPQQAARHEALVARLAEGEPLAYVLGRRAFYDQELAVSPAVLIPRPETEHLLEHALSYLQQHPRAHVADVGTGSGALAVTVAAHAPNVQVYALDISVEALAVARQNAANAGVSDRITFLLGDLLSPMVEQGLTCDLLLANLPYVASGELDHLAVSRYEPRLALDGGRDGLDLIRRVLKQAPILCNPGAVLLLEIGASQGEAVLRLAYEWLRGCRTELYQDYAGLDRVVRVELRP